MGPSSVAFFAKMEPLGSHSCATMNWEITLGKNDLKHNIYTSDHISVTTTYLMWLKERPWNVCVLKRVRLYNLVMLPSSALCP